MKKGEKSVSEWVVLLPIPSLVGYIGGVVGGCGGPGVVVYLWVGGLGEVGWVVEGEKIVCLRVIRPG